MTKQVDSAQLKAFSPIDSLKKDNLAALAKKTKVRDAQPGETLFREGDAEKRTFYVLSGTVELREGTQRSGRITGGSEDARNPLSPKLPRRHTAIATSAVEYITIDSDLLDVMLTWDQTGTFEVGELKHDDTGGDWMSKLLQMRTFQMVPPANLQGMFLKMKEVKVEPGMVIVRQGEDGDFFYVIMEGRCMVTREQGQAAGQKPVKLAELESGSCFGEEALISDTKRNATITMMTRGKLMKLSKDDFRQLLNEPLARKMSFAEAEKMVKDGKAKWLDVRLPSEFQAGSLPGAINMPLYLLRMKLASLEQGTAYIACCDTGRRSSVAVFVLTQKGYESYVLEKGIPPKT